MIYNCVICGKEININPSRYSIKGNCCSKKCLGQKNKAELNVTCYICKKQFHVKPYHLKNMKNPERITCSRKCSVFERKERMSINNHQFGLLGELNSSFKSDFMKNKYGYILVRDVNHPIKTKNNFVMFHRVVMEEFLISTGQYSILNFDNKTNRYYLPKKYIVHHINENKLDNRLHNLEVMLKKDHTKLHNKQLLINRNDVGNFINVEYVGKFKGNRLIKKHDLDAGQDICSNEEITILPLKSKLISTNLYIEIPSNHVGLIWSRSGLSVKNKLEVGAGCIDENYRGEIKVHLYNFGSENYIVKKGDKIAQLLTIPINNKPYIKVKKLSETSRGEGGFGSTGK